MTDATQAIPVPPEAQKVWDDLDEFAAKIPARVAAALADKDSEGNESEGKAMSLRKDLADWEKRASEVRLEQTDPHRAFVSGINDRYKVHLKPLGAPKSALTDHINGVVQRRDDAAQAAANARQKIIDDAAEAARAEEAATAAEAKRMQDAADAKNEEAKRAHNEPALAEKLRQEAAAAQVKADETAAAAKAAGATAEATTSAAAAVAAEAPAEAQARSIDGRNSNRQKTWASTLDDFGLVPDEFKLLNESAVKKALAAGREIPGISLKTGPESFRIVATGSKLR